MKYYVDTERLFNFLERYYTVSKEAKSRITNLIVFKYQGLPVFEVHNISQFTIDDVTEKDLSIMENYAHIIASACMWCIMDDCYGKEAKEIFYTKKFYQKQRIYLAIEMVREKNIVYTR